MASLFPESIPFEEQQITEQESERSKKTWAFDFEKGDFVRTPDGKTPFIEGIDAYKQWVMFILSTPRYRHLAYPRDYGHEFDDLIYRNLPREANESELKRIITETLMVNPQTKEVGDFSFSWEGDTVGYQFTVRTIWGEEQLEGRLIA
ncbi:DUF2634 domain-containing protein [Chengkuizengella sp. SCS-71B]|uniref:DUF2634 domain-containing protein n=1 Tax=Chengkuizengella sp. SCS-71B TaxID=3115290 RepID=UPI0032C20DA0